MRPAAAEAAAARKRHPLGYRQTAGRSLLKIYVRAPVREKTHLDCRDADRRLQSYKIIFGQKQFGKVIT